LSAAGRSSPADAKRCSDAASDHSGSVSPEANSASPLSASCAAIRDACHSPPHRATFIAMPSIIPSAMNSAVSTGDTIPSSIRIGSAPCFRSRW
jgi:hypothetical protein